MALSSSTMAWPLMFGISHPHKRPPGVEKANQEEALKGLSGKKKSGTNSQPHIQSPQSPGIWFSCLQVLGLTAPIQPWGKGPHLSRPPSAHLEVGNNSLWGWDVQSESDNRKWSEARCLKGARWIQDIAVVPVVSCSDTAVLLQWLLNFCSIQS